MLTGRPISLLYQHVQGGPMKYIKHVKELVLESAILAAKKNYLNLRFLLDF